MREFQILGCVDQEGVVVRKFLLTKVELDGLSPTSAAESGFVLDGDHWVREITPEVIMRETRHEQFFEKRLFPTKLRNVDGKIEQSPDFPVDTTFKRAWVVNGDTVVHDMVKARAIHLDRIRAARTPIFAKLDVDWMRATGQKDIAVADAIEAKRQKLRDIPQTIAANLEAAATPDQLRAVWPVELG